MTTYYIRNASPVGPLLLVSKGGRALTGLYMDGHARGPAIGEDWVCDGGSRPLAVFQDTSHQLREYFEGTLRTFTLPLDPEGTDFQKRVWAELAKIPYGTTVTYGEIARRLGDPKAVRAVGMANGRNPISIIVPCHRVIGASGKPIGYAGGIDRKNRLLSFEAECSGTPRPG